MTHTTSVPSDPIMDPFRRTLARTSLRDMCGHQIFCKGCGTILDCRRAVELEFSHRSTGEFAASRVICAACFDAKLAGGRIQAQMEGTAFSVEAIDGRVLFAREKRTRTRKSEARFQATEEQVLEGRIGYCTACGEQADVEPDVSGGFCQACHEPKVYGLEQLVVMGLVEVRS